MSTQAIETTNDVAAASQILLVVLPDIKPNPYQPRQQEDPAAIAEIALSIYRQGLMQIPVARPVNGHYELAFGHTRRAAYELLAVNGLPEQGIEPDVRFAHMPLHVRELDDRQMFEMAASENVKRQDLNTMELAAAMQRYLDDFSASSREAGELFGVTDATVRGMVRLLNLPAEVQAKVATGEISRNVAQRLVSIARLSVKAAEEAGKKIAAGSSPDYVLGDAFSGNRSVVKMHGRYDSGEPYAGKGLWPINTSAEKFPSGDLPALEPAAVTKAIGLESTSENKKRIAKWLQGELHPAEFPGDPDVLQRLEVLDNPPSCEACPFYAVIEKSHMCGLRSCHDRKSAAWLNAEARRLSKKMGIPLYDPDVDGKDYVPLNESYWQSERVKADGELVKQKHPDLRLGFKKEQYSEHLWTKSYRVRVIAVGNIAAKRRADEAKEKQANSAENREQQWKRLRELRDATDQFLQGHVFVLFAEAFKGLDNVEAFSSLVNRRLDKKTSKADQLADLRLEAARDALRSHGLDRSEGPHHVAKRLTKIAATWGVELPADFLAIAKQYEPDQAEEAQGVSTETGKRKGKK